MTENNAAATEDRTIKTKTQFKGKVIKINLAGAVLDIGAEKPGLLHVSQIVSPDGTPIKKVEDVLKVGEEVDVWVKRVARKDGDERIELTMIRPLDMEWREIKIGETVKGKVVRLEKFGAFVEIGAERPGLVHISEMAHGYVKLPSDVVKEGDEIEAQIIDVNKRKKQIKLSMKAILPEPEVVVEEKPKAAPRPANTEAKRERRPERKPRRKSEVDNSELIESISEPAEPEPTVMELAMRAAMEKAKDRKKKQETKKAKATTQVQDEILSRTLENKVQTN
ncbi:MAG TPA: S1 RNA-binding domain-containing protein [Anaerolineaceae bacterium]|nr:S1 RNA-binding domain-containing protein [Anaerolineaceae bacterium]